MILKDYFDLIQIISLPARTDRRRAIARELARAGMPVEPGKVEIFDALRPADGDAAGFPTIGARGCFLSHLTVLKRARAAGLARVLVLEDDVQLARRFRAPEPALVDRLRADDWGLVYFGHGIDLGPGLAPRLVPHAGPMYYTHFIGYNAAVFERLIGFLEALLTRPPGHPDGGPMHYDGALTTFRAQHPDVLTLLADPILGWQRSSRTDVSDLRWFDSVPLVRTAVGAARRGRAWLKSYR